MTAGVVPAGAGDPVTVGRRPSASLVLCIVRGYLGAGRSVLGLAGLVTAKGIADDPGLVLLTLVVVFFAWLLTSGQWTRVERKRLFVILGLFIAAAIFWSVFEQAGSTLNLFAEQARTIA